jgi:tRNA-specific 2-thiouridylase
VAAKPDSHDICFIADGDTQGWLAKRLGERPGQVVDTEGVVLGEHTGAYGFTVGQRKGLAIGRPAADGKPRYVLSIEPVSNTVVVGALADLEITRITGGRAGWCGPVPTAGDVVGVQVRAHGAEVPARVLAVYSGEVSSVEIEVDTPVRGVATGQTLTIYTGTRVLGASTITATA